MGLKTGLLGDAATLPCKGFKNLLFVQRARVWTRYVLLAFVCSFVRGWPIPNLHSDTPQAFKLQILRWARWIEGVAFGFEELLPSMV